MTDPRVRKVAEAILQYLRSHPDAGLYDDSPLDGIGFDGELNLIEIARTAIETLEAETSKSSR